MSEVSTRLRAAGLEMPAYQQLPSDFPRVRTLEVGELLFVSGHGPDAPGFPRLRGKVGRELDLAAGRQAARQTALNMLSTIDHEVGLDRVARMVKVLGMVRSAEGFGGQPAVIDGASEVFLTAFGRDLGIHTRSAVGMAELPDGIPVEIELQAQLHPVR
ncbi:RidA family protein [Agromyces aerolatus]|uniref:RidA family protein n=1 Tax=Agromyces sp. LY-1074 TaxID=3074080 RepID=UPI0028546B81|nr:MULTISPECIES: RidA family protein [unclassified Agromyces]MDR5701198.1 RidA family protein [Agromyces sp. LY-1074]MDR5706926.1 RidA family protein [Agromyces sp. LY-1358]